jgi:tol-pal system protein YbgF
LIIRSASAICLVIFIGCASLPTAEAYAEMTASLKALRAENARLEQQLQTFQTQGFLRKSEAVVPMGRALQTPAEGTIPALTIVKLKPKSESAPKLPTDILIQEPSEAAMATLSEASKPMDEDAADFAEAQYAKAFSLMNTGNTDRGVAQMQQFVMEWPRHPKADNALYFSGLALMNSQQIEAAVLQFETVISKYPAGDANLNALSRLAECQVKLKNDRSARATLEKIVSNYPGTMAASTAQQRLKSGSASLNTFEPAKPNPSRSP